MKKDPTSAVGFSPEDLKIIRASLKGADEIDIIRFIRVCERSGLDPITRQIYGRIQNEKVPAKGNQPESWKKSLVIITSIDGLRALSEKTGEYRGQTKPEWYYLDKDTNTLGWHDVFVPNTGNRGQPLNLPEACRVGVHRMNFVEPCYGYANFESFAGYVKVGTEWKLNHFWAKMPEHMIAKVAEAHAHRKAFPLVLGGLYIEEEVTDDDVDHEAIAAQRRSGEPEPTPGVTQVACQPIGTNAAQKAAEKPPETPATPPATPPATEPSPAKATRKKAEKPADAPAGKPADPAPQPEGPWWKAHVLSEVPLRRYLNRRVDDLDLDELTELKLKWVDKYRSQFEDGTKKLLDAKAIEDAFKEKSK